MQDGMMAAAGSHRREGGANQQVGRIRMKGEPGMCHLMGLCRPPGMEQQSRPVKKPCRRQGWRRHHRHGGGPASLSCWRV